MAIIPLLMVCALSGLRVRSSADQVFDYRDDRSLIDLAADLADLAHALESERDLTARNLVADARKERGQDRVANDGSTLEVSRSDVDELTARIARLAGQGAPFTTTARQQVAVASDTVPATLTTLRAAVDDASGRFPVSAALRSYGDAIAMVIDGLEDLTAAASDPALAERLRATVALSFSEEAVSRQRALVAIALERGALDPKEQLELDDATAARRTGLEYFFVIAEPSERSTYEDTVTGVDVDESERIRLLLANHLAGLTPGGNRSADVAKPSSWFASVSHTGGLMRQVRQGIEKTLRDDVNDKLRSALHASLINSAALVLLLAITFLITRAVALSITGPLRGLRSTALDVAGVRLPTVVRSLEESEGEPSEVIITPVAMEGRDEIAEVARAFDTVHAEAIRLAVQQAHLRASVNAMFVNLARRNQSLVERQLQLIDHLENAERDPDQLENLFRLDHMATRMRRHGEGLLVLANSEGFKTSRPPAPLLDVARAALGEVEDYQRVVVGEMPDTLLVSAAIDNTVHLLAELMENALRYSDTASQVTVSCRIVDHGDALIEVIDGGLGIEPPTLEVLNLRLALPGRPDVQTSRQMGLFVVARLASRHGMAVRLRPGAPVGTVAEVRIPRALLVRRGELPRRQPSPPFGQQLSVHDSSDIRHRPAPTSAPEVPAHSEPPDPQGPRPPRPNAVPTLPARVPGARLVASSLPSPEPTEHGPVTSPQELRTRLSAFHRGLQEGRRCLDTPTAGMPHPTAPEENP
ncbi:nitrate- and nitrite sensing domain-containing protein [Streptomyces sp. NPDC056661]|uniref:sensor histidine kinase n=1 Tax=Streptomyces sp. NPDC056661 TaxID=3345898 RepID=UPI00368D02EC